MDWSRRQLMASAAALGAGLLVPRARAAPGDLPLHLIVVTATGGWDVSYVLDPKPESVLVDGPELDEDADEPEDRERLVSYGDIAISSNPFKRPAVDRFFNAWADRSVLARGVWVGSISHDACRARMLTGGSEEGRADLAAMVADATGRSAAIPSIDLGGTASAGPLAAITGRAGRNGQLAALLDRSTPMSGPTGSGVRYPQYQPQPAARDAMSTWLAEREARFAATWSGRPGAEQRLADLTEARARAQRLRAEGPDFARALSRADAATFGGQASLAVQLIESQLAHTVVVDSGLNWDSHDNNAEQHGHHEALFHGLDGLMTELADAALLDRTVVVVLSEMTRTPRRNEAGGKDHWPVTSSLLLGGPLRGARVLGGTDDALDALPVDLSTGRPSPSGTVLRYDHLHAGLLDLLGARPGDWLPGVPLLGGLRA